MSWRLSPEAEKHAQGWGCTYGSKLSFLFFIFLNHAVSCSHRSLPLPVCLSCHLYNVEHCASNVRNPAQDREFDSPRQKFWIAWHVFQSIQFVDVLKHILETLHFNTSLKVTFGTIFVPLFFALFCFCFLVVVFMNIKFNQQPSWAVPKAILWGWITNKTHFKF